MKNIKWNVKLSNPLNGESIEHKLYDSIEHIHKEHSYLPLPTCRNIAMGRSKVYHPFITVEKENYTETE